MEQSNRYKKRWNKLKEIDGEAGEKVINGLKDISPDLGKFIIEYLFGDIYTREGLDKKHRPIATIVALTALGSAQPQLKFHINAGLNIGLTIENVREIMLLMTIKH